MGSADSAIDLSAVVERLNELTERLEVALPSATARPLQVYPNDVPVQMMEAIYAGRRLRASIFGADADLFGEPAWDMMLDAAIMEGKGKRVSVTSACLASDVPPTTALRYLSALEERELMVRETDPLDNRRRYVKLTPKGKRLLKDYIGALVDARQAVTRV